MPNVTDVGLKPRPIKKVAVIGGGLMGSGIATALLLSNIKVVLKEINSEYLMKGTKSVEGYYLIHNISSCYFIEVSILVTYQKIELLSTLSQTKIILRKNWLQNKKVLLDDVLYMVVCSPKKLESVQTLQ